ncbi:Sphingosine kinase 1 [Sarcoptes scabiei]|uniref:Sphingosine kinase 1 n=2 Tax=Sarcoptes scabiei TaxID=52283 RepID=A0A834VCM3_SARSC|nr:Sphingosine kinase 1 [Sarcoptes scabiei]
MFFSNLLSPFTAWIDGNDVDDFIHDFLLKSRAHFLSSVFFTFLIFVFGSNYLRFCFKNRMAQCSWCDRINSKDNNDGDDGLLWTSICFLFRQGNFETIPTTLKLTTNGVHFIRNTKLNECYRIDEIARCSILSSSNHYRDKIYYSSVEDDDDVDIDVDVDHHREQKEDKRKYCPEFGRKPSRNDLPINLNQINRPNCTALSLIVYQRKSRKFQRKQILFLIESSTSELFHSNKSKISSSIEKRFQSNLDEINPLKMKLDFLISKEGPKKPLLLILNPKSGSGRAIKLFEGSLKPFFEDYRVKYQVLTTKHAGHALEYIEKHSNLNELYSAIVTLSGDGLLFEVINGFQSRLENANPQKIPIPLGIIPGGSGNGLACSINSIYYPGTKSTAIDQLTECILHVIKGDPKPMDIVRIRTPDRIYFSFLCFGWGLLSDIDIESESLRFLGESRFSIWALYRSIASKRYRGRLSYLPFDSQSNEIPSLSEMTPENWITVDGEFCLVYASYQKYLNSTTIFAPDARLDDGRIHLAYIKGDVNVFQVIQFLLKLADGMHVKLPYVHFVLVKAFRLTPHGSNDIMTVDGERIPCSMVQADLLPKLASILVRS